MAQSFAAGRAEDAHAILRRVLNLTLALSGMLIAASAVGGRAVLTHLYRAEYAGSRTLLILMMCAAAAANMASVYGYALLAARRFGAYLTCLVVSSAATAVACAVAVPRLGTMGAAAGCLAGYAVQLVISRAMLSPEFRQETLHFDAAAAVPEVLT
jgi:O-antigen/teichoic acid export membrane protein